jgi:hypothetical protein
MMFAGTLNFACASLTASCRVSPAQQTLSESVGTQKMRHQQDSKQHWAPAWDKLSRSAPTKLAALCQTMGGSVPRGMSTSQLTRTLHSVASMFCRQRQQV